jgi:SAM-dependent methyltransferase
MGSRGTASQRGRRERAHFGAVASGDRELYWADRTPAGRRRQLIRADLLRLAARIEGVRDARVLDVGCGLGSYSRPFARQTDAEVIAIDVTPELLQRGRSEVVANLKFAAADASALPFPDQCFDALVGNAVLHHLPLPSAVPELLRVLKPGGRFCFAEPNLLNPQVMLERKVPLLRRWLENSPDETAFTRWGICERLESLGLTEVSVRPFDFLYPATPRPLISTIESLGRVLEQIPGVREIAGSLLITARRP